MKCTRIYYEKCFNLGNYQNEKVGVELELAEGETATEVLKAARIFVELGNPKKEDQIEAAKSIIANPNSCSYSAVVRAKELIDSQPKEDDLPF
jgi:hypothetical protein